MPLVIGRAVHLHPVITIFAVLVGLSAWGILGGLLGVPVAAALNVTLHEFYPEETGRDSEDAAAQRAAEKPLIEPRVRSGRVRARVDTTMATRTRPAALEPPAAAEPPAGPAAERP